MYRSKSTCGKLQSSIFIVSYPDQRLLEPVSYYLYFDCIGEECSYIKKFIVEVQNSFCPNILSCDLFHPILICKVLTDRNGSFPLYLKSASCFSLVFCTRLLPVNATDALGEFMGILDLMDEFKGRKKD